MTKKSTFIGNSKTLYSNPTFSSANVFVQSDMDIAAKLLKKRYERALQKKKNSIILELVHVAPSPIRLQDNQVSDIFCKICDIISDTDVNIRSVTNQIKSYLERDCRFFNFPSYIESLERIHKAYVAVREGKPKQHVIDILYKV